MIKPEHRISAKSVRGIHAVPRKAAGDVRAYDRVETEPGLDKFVDDTEGEDLIPLPSHRL